ncbi:alkaline phosphatase D family protein [Gloeobacter kilaueensis]|uniref:Alkaline phosphatase n=1 Tax=Gloeobacter kilaueensis (strain ATCC BAA-2537 / CCAP 1431/1 / ULC 316 / JS1) TaxID=1183438 RepID=U5QEA6_GLOK1|nr:alkaline phosphatase D family protein [Gloeobacter kilaueensis]AGY57292.1 alkaline phosphatase [Gloeobacter kilaueensis JS1]
MFNRRSVLKGTLAVPALLLAGESGFAQATDDYGVASGEPQPDGVLLWTRVPEAFQGSGAVTVRYEVAADSGFSTIVATGSQVTDASSDYTVKVRVSGLAAFSRYYYRFTSDTGYTSVTGRTKTAPAAGSEPARLTFAYVSCQDFTQGYYTVFAAIVADDDADFCVHLGDNIYETGAADFQKGQVRLDTIGGGEATTLDEYRQKYRLYLSDANYREVRRQFCWIHLWDDHEVFNNYAGTELTSASDEARQAAGYQAFLEYLPVEPVSPLAIGSDGKASVQLYRKLSFGSLADLFVLDERQYRDGVVCKSDLFTPPCPELDDPARTMLGTSQKTWLKDNLAASAARWKVILNEVMAMRFAAIDISLFGPTGQAPRYFDRALPIKNPRLYQGANQDLINSLTLYINLDAWDGYPAERQELLQFIGDRQIKNVVFWTGDIHNCYAGLLKPDFTDPNSPTVAVEVVGGSVSSAGVYELVGGLNLTALGRLLLQATNPHILYLDLKYHVYSKAVITPDSMQVSYRAVKSIVSTTSSRFTLKSFTIPNGQPQLIVN